MNFDAGKSTVLLPLQELPLQHGDLEERKKERRVPEKLERPVLSSLSAAKMCKSSKSAVRAANMWCAKESNDSNALKMIYIFPNMFYFYKTNN